ncbi:MAG: hypothetical protein ACPG51_20190 [Thiolinea sp.]
MLNGDLKKSALHKLEKAHSVYQTEIKHTQESSEKLYSLRQSSSEEVLASVEDYVNSLTNHPKEFDRSFAEFRAEYQTFNQIINDIKNEADGVDIKAGGSAAAGVATGVGVAALAPTAAMAVATTFGAASTGTAISALSGAAATNAALAWLGGGALAAGGGGMAAGNALLALAGPVGWAIGGTALVGGTMFARSKNKKVAEAANNKRREIEVYNKQLQTAQHEVGKLHDLTSQHVQGMMQTLAVLKSDAPTNYQQFSSDQKNRLSALVNHVRSLSVLLNKKIET